MYSDIKRRDACEILQALAANSFGKAARDDRHGSTARTDQDRSSKPVIHLEDREQA
jgi:hypothetical protein